MKQAILKTAIYLAVAALCVAAVWSVAYLLVGNDFLLPSFTDCLVRLGALCVSGEFWLGVGSTLLRVLLAFVLSLVIGGGLGVVAYACKPLEKVLSPILSLVRPLPVLAVILILLTWTKASVAPIIVAALSLTPILYTATYSALCGVDSELVEMSRVYKVPLKRQIAQLYLPAVFPTLIRESGAAVAFGVKLVVSAEVLALTAVGLGGYMQSANATLDISKLFALVIASSLIAVLFESVCLVLADGAQRRLQ